jgi:hypothetical protein
MAVTYVDGDVSADTTSVSSVTGLAWVSHNAADLAIVGWALLNTATPTLDAALTNSSNQVDTNVRGIIGTKVTAGSESGAISLTCDGASANRMAGALALYRNCILGQIVFLGEASGTAQTSHTCPAITPAVAGSGFVLVFFERVTSTVAPAGTPSGFQKRKEWSTGGTGGTSVVVYDDLSGTHGTTTFTPANVVSLTASTSALVFLIELKPASQTITFGVASETDSAVGMVFTKALVVGVASETDTAPAAVSSKTASLLAAAETDSATALVAAKVITLGLATETDTAAAVTDAKSIIFGQATEADTAPAATLTKAVSFAIDSETDTAPSAVFTRTANQLGQATETDSAQAVAVSKILTLGLATESDIALAMSFVAAGVTEFGVAAESDTAYAVLPSKQLVFGVATETDSTMPMVLSKAAPIGVGTETDMAFALIVSGLTDIDFAIAAETDSALPLSTSKTAVLARTDETDTAAALNATKVFALAIATETDAAGSLAFGQPAHVPGLLVASHSGPTLTVSNRPSSRLEASHGV